MNFKSVDEALDFAIEREQEAADFYTDLASRAEHQHMSEVFTGFAGEEMGHKAKLESVKSGQKLLSAEKKVQDLKLGDYLVEAPASAKSDLTYQDALILAMKLEKSAYRLYHDLSSATDDATVRQLFLGLAQEEAKHKLRFEIEYDERILTEN